MFDYTPFEVVPIGELVLENENRDPRKSPDWTFQYVDIASVSNSTFEIVSSKPYVGSDAPSRARKVIRENDVIFATTRPYLKSIARVTSDLDGHICSTGFCVLRPSARVLPEWVFYCASSDDFLEQITPKMRGANYPAVTDKDVLSAKVPIPPLAEQRRIVARIKECMERVEEIERLQESVVYDAERLVAAFRYDLWESCSASVTPTELRLLIRSTKNGLYKPNNFHGSGSVLLRMFNIDGARLNLDRIVRLEVTTKESEDYQVCNGDIIVSRVNSRELVGKSALVEGLNEPAVHEAMIIRLRIDDERVDKRFLVWLMNSPQFLHNLRRRAKHAIGQSSINQDDLLSSELPLPSRSEQTALVKENITLEPFATELANEYAEKVNILARLRESILRQAFAGEL